jgi:hypothetical protein
VTIYSTDLQDHPQLPFPHPMLWKLYTYLADRGSGAELQTNAAENILQYLFQERLQMPWNLLYLYVNAAVAYKQKYWMNVYILSTNVQIKTFYLRTVNADMYAFRHAHTPTENMSHLLKIYLGHSQRQHISRR